MRGIKLWERQINVVKYVENYKLSFSKRTETLKVKVIHEELEP